VCGDADIQETLEQRCARGVPVAVGGSEERLEGGHDAFELRRQKYGI
jgi:hypothetical protein